MVSDRGVTPATQAVPGCGDAAGKSGVFHHICPANPHAVRDALRGAVARFARQMSPENAGTLELVLAEVLNNVVEHAYADHLPERTESPGIEGQRIGGQRPSPNWGTIDLHLARVADALVCAVTDCGAPMPGLALPGGPMPALTDEIAGLAEGGWGWALIREMTTDLAYRHSDGINRLSFRIPLNLR